MKLFDCAIAALALGCNFVGALQRSNGTKIEPADWEHYEKLGYVPDDYIIIFNKDLGDEPWKDDFSKFQDLITNEIELTHPKNAELKEKFKHFKANTHFDIRDKHSSHELFRGMFMDLDDDMYDFLSNDEDLKNAFTIVRNVIIRNSSATNCSAQYFTSSSVYNLPQLTSNVSGYIYSSYAGENQTIYVVDTGIYVDHPDFEGRASWGPDFTGEGFTDDNGHGTHVAGTVISKNYGVAKKAKAIAVKVLGATGSGTSTALINALNWISQNANGSSIINLSLSGSTSFQVIQITNTLVNQGIPVVVAAGNNNEDASGSSPANVQNATTVGSVGVVSSDGTYTRSSFSNYGSDVDCFASGENIISLDYKSDGYRTLSGTSQATPAVAGLFALYRSDYETANPGLPTLTPAELNAMLTQEGQVNVVVDNLNSNNLYVQAPVCNGEIVSSFTTGGDATTMLPSMVALSFVLLASFMF